MVSGESPAVARRHLRLALRKAREAKGFTQGQVAEALDWSLSKVQRIESGDVTVSSTDLQAMLARFGVTDPERIDQLIETARASRRKGWWDDLKYREHLTPATMQLLQFESEASAIRYFHPTLLPGLLQTPAYAEFILNFWNNELSEADRAVRLEVRMRRREFVLGRPDPPQYLLVLDESVLFREVGGPQVMAEQLHELLKLMREPNIIARILPYSAANLPELNPFIVFDFGDEENAVLYREAQLADEIVHLPDRIRLYRGRFEHMWAEALSEDATARLIEARAATMLSSADRPRPDS